MNGSSEGQLSRFQRRPDRDTEGGVGGCSNWCRAGVEADEGRDRLRPAAEGGREPPTELPELLASRRAPVRLNRDAAGNGAWPATPPDPRMSIMSIGNQANLIAICRSAANVVFEVKIHGRPADPA